LRTISPQSLHSLIISIIATFFPLFIHLKPLTRFVVRRYHWNCRDNYPSINAVMVHLALIPNDKERDLPLVEGLKGVTLAGHDPDLFTSSVYGSRFAAEDLPKIEMPEHEMPKEVAYRMIKDDLSLDGNPMLK
jgi:hypothetical protein